jgi:hypothetical protein
VNVLYWNILIHRSPQDEIFHHIEPEDYRFCGTYEPWSAAVFEIACAFYLLIEELSSLLGCKFDFRRRVSKEFKTPARFNFVRVAKEDNDIDWKRVHRRTFDECTEADKQRVAKMLGYRTIDRDIQRWLDRIDYVSIAKRHQSDDGLIVNIVGSLLVLQTYQDRIPPSIAMYDFAGDPVFSDAVLSHIHETYETADSQTQYTNINAERRELLRNYLSLSVKKFDSSPPAFLDSRIYSGAHLCVACWHPASRSWLQVHLEGASDNLTPVESMYQSDEYIACISGTEDRRISVSPPATAADATEVWIQAYHIYADLQGERRTNRHSFTPHRVAGFMLLEVSGSCNIKTHTLIGPVKTSFSSTVLAPAVAEGKEVEIDVEFLTGSSGTWKVAQVLLMEERKKLNEYNERLFMSIMALNRREAKETGGATALAQNNPYIFLPATAVARVHDNLLTMDDVEKMISRALRRLGMSDSHCIDYYLDLSRKSSWGVRRLREIIHMLFVDYAMVAYDTDRINRTQLEQMMSVVVTGSGDCEDGAIALYQILVSLRRMWSAGKRTSNASFDKLIQYVCTEYAPALCNFRAKSSSHGVANDSPRGQTISHNAAILIPISAAAKRIALPIVLETTGVASLSTPINSDEELSLGEKETAGAVMEHLFRRQRIYDKLTKLGFDGFAPPPSSEKRVDDFYDYSQYVCSTEMGGLESTTLRFDHDFQAAARRSLDTPVKGAIADAEPSALIDRCAVFIPPKQIRVDNDEKCMRCKDFVAAHAILTNLCDAVMRKNPHWSSLESSKNTSMITPRATTFFFATSEYTEEQITSKLDNALTFLNGEKESWQLSVQHCMSTVLFIELFVDHGQH